ncbi:carboxymuconolactone decarboxylase family protein [Novosphingobium sp. BL-52-GroH]|uniref:carboxymuconolactone decarboxylase family protein n=1 Tax=Novosphingobium sp. BL-52-GroH TaxID=3349877 RepID=UPI00384C18CB
MSIDEAQWQKGLEVFDQVYGPGSSEMTRPYRDSSFNQEIVGNQFANLWGSEVLSMREKRLLVLGATAMLGRPDLVEIQMNGALINGEFTDEELDFIPLFVLFYAGAGNTTAVFRGIEAAKARRKERSAVAE